MKYRLSSAAQRLQGQPMFKLLAKAKKMEREGRNLVHFEIGDPDFDTPANIRQAAIRSLEAGETHYTSSMGIADFRQCICETTHRTRGFLPDVEQVLVAPGANIIIYYAILCLVEPGDEVIVPDPGFPTYYSAIALAGVVPIRVPLREGNAFGMDPEEVRSLVTPKTRLIIMNSPHNPTGAVMTHDAIARMARVAEEADVYLYSDEIYARMIFDEASRFSSPSSHDLCRKRTIVANGFSKAFAMTGWRLGAAIAPTDVIEKMGLLLQTTSSCVSQFIQRAGVEAIHGDQSAVRAMMSEYRARRDLMVEGLNRIPGITCLNPGGAFYVFPNIRGTGLTSGEFANLMLEKGGVCLLPGSDFGEHGEGYVRLCYAASRERIREGLDRIRDALAARGRP